MDADPAGYAELGRALQSVVEGAQTIILFHHGENYCLTVTFQDSAPRRVTITRATLLESLLAALNRELEKKCLRCKKRRRLSQFSRDANRPDGHNKYCFVCERQRMKRYRR